MTNKFIYIILFISFFSFAEKADKDQPIIIDSDDIDSLNADDVAKKALATYVDSSKQSDLFPADRANPIYLSIPQYKKINE